jgi:acyl carrier protein
MQTEHSDSEVSTMARQRVLEDVKTIVSGQLDVPESQVHESSDLENDLGCDSLGKVEIVMELEDHFGVDVPDTVADEVRTVGNIVDGVMRLLGATS